MSSAFSLYWMRREIKFSDGKQTKTLTLNETGMSSCNISRKLERLRAAVNSFLRNPKAS